MMDIKIGDVSLNVSKQELLLFLEKTYDKNYRKEKIKHLSSNDKRLPKIKVTADLVSFSIYVKDKNGDEHRLVFDGKIKDDDICLYQVDKTHFFELNQFEYNAILDILKQLSSHCEGRILLMINDRPKCLHRGFVEDGSTLLKRIFEKLPKEEQNNQETKDIFEWLIECL